MTDTKLSCAELLKVLADETRLAVVRQLIDGPKYVGEMQAEIELEQSLLSHHLRVLRESGIVTAERDGKSVLYSLSPEMRAARKGQAVNLGCCQISFE